MKTKLQMKTKLKTLLVGLALLPILHPQLSTFAQGTTFTYQGRLNDGALPATGVYDLQFSLWNAPSGPSQIGGTVAVADLPITNGLFTVTLDFGAGAFEGSARWLEVDVRAGDSGGVYTALARTQILPSPYAMYAGLAATATTATTATTASGVAANAVTSAGIANGTITLADLNTASVDGRYVLKAGDTMTGALTAPDLTVSGTVTARLIDSSPNNILSAKSPADIELTIDKNNSGPIIGAFEIFNGAGSHVFAVSETGNARTYGNHVVDGNVGIGTITPTSELHVNGSVQLDKTGPALGRLILNTVTRNDPGRFGIQFNNNTLGLFLGDDTQEQDFGFYSGWSANRTNDAKLRVHGKATGSWGKYIELTHNGTNGFLSTDAGDLILSPAGDVGIGTTTPSYRLDTRSSGFYTFNAETSGGENVMQLKTTSTGGRAWWLISGGSSGALSGGRFGIFDSTAFSTRLAIDTSGNVGIGTTAPTQKLEVNGTVKATSFSGDGSGLTTAGLVRTTVLDVPNVGVNFSTTYVKVGNIGTFSKLQAGSTIEVTFHGRVYAATIAGSGARFELRVDDTATTNGRARALLPMGDAGFSYGRNVGITGIFTGLGSGTHTVSMWVQGVSGGGTSATIEPGNFGTDHVVVKELK